MFGLQEDIFDLINGEHLGIVYSGSLHIAFGLVTAICETAYAIQITILAKLNFNDFFPKKPIEYG